MKNRPLSITLLGRLFIVAGALSLVVHSKDWKIRQPFDYLVSLILLIRLLAPVLGIYMLRGSNWARWGTILWMHFMLGLAVFIP